MSQEITTALNYFQENRQLFLDSLIDFVRIPSISTDPEANADLQRAAEWLADYLGKLGLVNVNIHPTAGHPVVYGENLEAGADKPTVLIYGHYDVQPADPIELWETPPFEPTQRGENLYGRGASDMKGQVLASLFALEALRRSSQLPVNIKCIFEGEEEIGSPNLEGFLHQNAALLTSDLALNPDTGMIGPQSPTITYGLRGLSYFEIRVAGPDHDLHSGLFGGTVHNPAQVLCDLIAGMHDKYGRITLPGFYDKVQSLDEEERSELARLPLDREFYLQQTGVPELFGEKGYSPYERVGARPTLEVNGFLSGFTGEGQKTVLPAKAMAKISMRLVPEQDPDEVHQQLLRYMEKNAPSTVHWEVLKMSTAKPAIADRSTRGVVTMRQALETTWGKRPIFRREGGTVPVVAAIQDILGIDTVNTGFGLPDDNLHAPNEKVHLPTLYKGIEALIHFYSNLAS